MPSTWSWRLRGLVGLLSVIWGLNFLFLKVGLEYASPLWLALLRAIAGTAGTAALMIPFAPWRALDRRARRDAMLIGLPSTTAFYALLLLGIEQVLPGFAAVLTYTFPLWVVFFSPSVLGHRLTSRLALAVGAGFVGVILVSQPWSDLHAGIAATAVVELLGAAVAWAIGTVVFQRRFARGQMLGANLYQLIGGSVGLAVVLGILAPTPLPRFSVDLAWVVVWLGLIGTAVAYTLWSYLLGHTKAATLSAYVFLVPVVALVASAVIFQERLSPLQLVGVGLVLVAIYGVGTAPGAHDIGRSEPPG